MLILHSFLHILPNVLTRRIFFIIKNSRASLVNSVLMLPSPWVIEWQRFLIPFYALLISYFFHERVKLRLNHSLFVMFNIIFAFFFVTLPSSTRITNHNSFSYAILKKCLKYFSVHCWDLLLLMISVFQIGFFRVSE